MLVESFYKNGQPMSMSEKRKAGGRYESAPPASQEVYLV
jgi:hypothetical protein